MRRPTYESADERDARGLGSLRQLARRLLRGGERNRAKVDSPEHTTACRPPRYQRRRASAVFHILHRDCRWSYTGRPLLKPLPFTKSHGRQPSTMGRRVCRRTPDDPLSFLGALRVWSPRDLPVLLVERLCTHLSCDVHGLPFLDAGLPQLGHQRELTFQSAWQCQ